MGAAAWVLFTTARGVAATTPEATAAPPTADESLGRAHFERGVAAYDEGRFNEALVEFQAASSALAAAQLHFNLAETYRALGRIPEALDEYERFLGKPEGDTSYRADAETALRELEPTVARLEVHADADAELTIDGNSRSIPGAGRPIRLPPGPHRLAVTKRGHVPFMRALSLDAGGLTRIDVTLPPILLATSDAAISRNDPMVLGAGVDKSTKRPFYRSAWFYGVAGATLVTAGVALTWALWPRHCEATADVPCLQIK